MISVEKRRSSRKSGKHRKRSDTSSGGSFLDENDREVSSLTDRAFKSLCIGDEAVYNDSHLGLPSSSTHIDRQLAFAQDEPFRDEEEREELKRAAHQNFSLRVQQYGQDWVHEGMYGTSTHKDPEWGVYGDRTQGRVSATFQNSFVETSQQGMSLREEELSFISNGATELSLQHHRSRSRVSSLIRTFNSEVKRNGANINDQFRGCNVETNWDKSALMNIHNEFSDFSSSYQQNLNSSSNFPSAGPFSCRDDNFYSSDMAAVAHMSHNSVSSFMRSSHNELSMSAQANCNSPFFIHSEFSPFKVWREHNRFPFQQREISGFMHCSQFPKWYETPMYKELSLENQLQGPYRGMRHSSSNLAPRAPSNPSHFTSMSLMQQKASAVEKRSESELAGHYPQRRRTQTLGTNKLPCQRPSTASPTVEMSRRVRDTISSVKALQQKIKVMSQQNISAGVITTQQESFRNHNLFQYGNNAAPKMVSSDISTTPFTISQLPTPSVTAHQEENTSGFQQHEASPQPVEHPPVRAESRGVTPDARLSSYKSRATSLLFNLKDNRKRVKSTYSPTKFKGLDKQEKNQQPLIQEPRETVIDVPDCLDPDIQFLQQENSRSTIMAANQYQNPALTLETQLERVNTGQYLENTSTDYQTAQVQGGMICHSGFSGFISGNYTSNQLTNGQNRHEYLASFTPYKQGGRDNSQLQEGLQHPHAAADITRLNIDRSQSKDSLIRTAEAEQALNEPLGKVITERGRYENFQDEINNHHNTSSNSKWQNCKDTEKVSLKAAALPIKQNSVHLMERQENPRNVHKATENVEAMESLSFESSSHKSVSSVGNSFLHKSNAKKEQNVQDMRDDVALNYNTHANKDNKRPNQLNPTTDNAKLNAAQIKTYTSLMTEDEKQILQLPKSRNTGQEKSSVCTDNASEFMMANQMNHEEFDGVKGEQAMAENKRVKHGKAQMAAAQQRADAEQPKAESNRLILTGQTDPQTDKTDSKAEATKAETLKQECMKKEESKGELKEDEREKHPEKSMGQHAAVKTKAWMSTDESTGVLGKDENTETKQVKHFKREQEETEKPEEKQKITQTAAIERVKECRTAQETDKTNNPEQAETDWLRKEQAESGLIETEQVKTEKIQVEEAETKCKTTEKTEQTDDQNNKTKLTKTEEEEGRRMTHVVQSKTEKDSTLSRQVNAGQSTMCDFKGTKPEERKAEQLKQEERKVELSKAELLKTENLLEKSAKLTAKLVATQQVRNESDKVEHVKTELAKAKAELAKIKEKMRGEPKEKVSSNVIVREDETLKNNSSSSVVAVKKAEQQTEDQAVELKTDRIPDDYERLKEKYRFIHATSTLKSNLSASESALGPVSGAKMETVTAGNNEDSKSPASTFLKSNTQSTKKVINFRENEATEGHVDNNSSKETSIVKFSHMNEYERVNEEDVADKLKVANVKKKQNIDSKIDNVSPQSNSEMAKLHPHDGKPNSTEHSKSTGKEPQIAFPKTLSYKEKAQTKQEILTSKIKAHAEKEISALKEKGFSLSKNSSKQLVGSQSFNVRQKPLSQDDAKKHEGALSNYVSPKHPLESSDVKTELEFGRTPTQTVEKPSKTNPTANNIKTTESSEKKHTEVKSSMQNSEQASKIDQQKQQDNQREATKKQSDEVKDQPTSKAIIYKGFEDLTQAVESKPLTIKNSEREETTYEDPQPPNTALGQTDLREADDSLQIMGIMVTVREGKPPQTVDESINADERQMKFSKKEGNESELDRRQFSPGCEGNTCSKEMNSVKAVKGQKSHSTMSESLAKAVESTSPETPKETLSLEAKDINVARAAIEKTINPQQGNPTLLPKPVTQTDVMKGTHLIKTDAEKSKEQTALGNSDFISNVVTTGPEGHSDSEISSKKLTETFGLKCTNIDVQTASSSEDSKEHSAKLFSNATLTSSSTEHENKHLPPDLQNKETDIRDSSHGDDNLHIDSIAVRVVPAVTDNNKRNIVEKPLIADFPSSASSAAEKQQTAASSSKANDEQCSEDVSSASSEHRMKETLENNLAVQHVLSSVRKLSDLLKMNSKVSNLNVVNETAEANAESNVELKELDYFQVQGQVETNNEAQNNCTTEKATAKKSELQDTPPNKTASIEDLPKDGKSEVFVFSVDHCLKKEDLISENPQDDSIKRNKLEAVDTPASKLNTSSFEPCNNEGKVNVSQANHIGKNPSENPCSLSATDKENSRPFPQIKAEKVTIKSDVKPKSKDKTSAIPEISAIADYARLKVIVSEERELNTAQDFPPSKKEGFFPLIRSHHSRRPVFTTDSQGSSVKEKSSSTKPDVSVKVSKEPKATIFPITEREHQRTGMFKMGDKDKQEKMLLETDRTLLAQTKQVSEVEIREIHQKTGQPNSSSAVSGLTSKELTYLDKNLPSQAALGERHHTKENTTYLRKDESPENQQNININVKGGRADRLKKERLANQEDDNKMKKLEKGKQLEEELMTRVDNRKNNVRIEHIMEESRASLAEEERRAAQREEEKRAKEREAVAQMIKERREQQRQADKKTEEERKTTCKEDTITDPNIKDFQTKTKNQIRIPEHEKCRFGQEQLRRTATEQQWKYTQENQHGRAAREQILDQQIKRESDTQDKQIIQGKQQQVEQQSKLLQKEHQQRAAEEQQSRSFTREKEKRATEEQKTRFTQEEKQIVTLEQQQRRSAKEKDNRRAMEEHQKELVQTEQQKIPAEEQQIRQAEEEKQRKIVEEQQRQTEELLRRSTEKQHWRTAQEEQQKRIVEEEGLDQDGQQKRRSAEEQQRQFAQKGEQKGEIHVQKRRCVLEEQQRRAEEEQQGKLFQEKQQRKAAEEQQRKLFQEEQHRKAAEEQQRKLFQEEQQRKAAEEQQRKLFQEEQQRKAAEEQQRKLFQEEQQRKAAEEQQRKLFQEEQQRKPAEEQQRTLFQEEQQRRAKEEQQRKLFQEKQQRKPAEEQQRKLFQEEQQRKAAEEQHRKLFQEEQQRRAKEEQQRKLFQEKQQRKAAEEQQRKLFQEEQQRKAAEEQQRKLFQEEQQRKAAEEQHRKLFQEEQQRRAKEEQQRKLFQEKQQRKAAEEQQRKLFQEEQQRKAAEEQQRKLFQEEQQRKAAEEQQRKLFQEEQQRKAAEGQQRKHCQDEKQRQAETEQQIRRLQEKQQRKAAEEHQKITTEGRQGKCFQKEQERGAAKEQEKTIALEDKQHRTIEKKQITPQDEHQNVLAKEEDLSRVAEQIHESTLSKKVYKKEHMPEQEKEEQQIEKLRRRRSLNHTLMKTKEEGVMAVDEKETTLKPEEKLVQDQSAKLLEEKIIAGDLIQEKSKKKEENLAINRGKTGVSQAEIQKQTQKMDGLQYYAFTSTDMEVKSREKRLSSLLRSEQRSSPVRLDSPDDSIIQTKSSRPLAPASPAPSLPRSNTSSPALGTKPSMFKVKDNTIRSSSFIKSVKPRFHKNFGDDFLLASTLDRSLEKVDDERERIKSGAGTPVHTEIGTKQFSANTEFSTLFSSSAQDYSFSHHRPYSRRSIALDDDESRSVISNLSEDVESYATSAADVGDVRGLLDFERPESACSFSSDVSRSLGKPPVVPPKTEKALRRAQRLTSRRMKKELSKVSAGGDKETSSVPSSSTETHQSNNDAVASPHFSQPVSLAHAPVLGSTLPPSSSELQPVLRSFHSSPHATGPVSVPILPNATSSVSLPTVSPHTPGTDSQPAAPKTVSNAPSSSTLHHANHPTPVAQYHVESSCFSQSYPMTQRKVLQDLGSGQYYVVDVPVQVQTKTFFDPETGKYVQLNVRESGQSISRPHTQHTQLHQTKLQPQPFTQTPTAGKPFVLYQRYHSYPQNYQPTANTPVRRSRSSAPGSLQQNHESLSESKIYGNMANEVEQNSVEPCYSPERTPYMDTVIDTDKTHNSVKSTQNPMESASECGTKNQTENHETSFQYQGRDIITMSELEDFMEATEW
ncbi:titin isoform X2 [Oryzias latipes]|uniref:titin isoform X2 n=1 Tax=Oryzias latipes TaxID=8090 RepID=UPI000CE1B409|nr:titin isoform X2 [Oryzias latipes]